MDRLHSIMLFPFLKIQGYRLLCLFKQRNIVSEALVYSTQTIYIVIDKEYFHVVYINSLLFQIFAGMIIKNKLTVLFKPDYSH